MEPISTLKPVMCADDVMLTHWMPHKTQCTKKRHVSVHIGWINHLKSAATNLQNDTPVLKVKISDIITDVRSFKHRRRRFPSQHNEKVRYKKFYSQFLSLGCSKFCISVRSASNLKNFMKKYLLQATWCDLKKNKQKKKHFCHIQSVPSGFAASYRGKSVILNTDVIFSVQQNIAFLSDLEKFNFN